MFKDKMKSQRSKRKKNMSLEGMGVVRERGRDGGSGGAGGGGGGGVRIAICVKDAKATKIVSIMLFKTNKKMVYYIRRCYIWRYNRRLM